MHAFFYLVIKIKYYKYLSFYFCLISKVPKVLNNKEEHLYGSFTYILPEFTFIITLYPSRPN